MNLTLKYNGKPLQQHVRRFRDMVDAPTRRYLREVAFVLSTAINASTHEDTGRFKRSWAQAARQVGAATVMVPLKPSEYAAFIRAKANKDHRKWGDRSRESNRRLREAEDRLRGAVRRGGAAGIGKAKAGVRRAKERADKLRIRYEESFDKVKTVDRAIAGNKAIGSIGLRGKGEIQIISRAYGGRGRWVQALPGVWAINLQSLEPHARIVESNYGVLRNAMTIVRAVTGAGQLPARYMRDIASAWNRKVG